MHSKGCGGGTGTGPSLTGFPQNHQWEWGRGWGWAMGQQVPPAARRTPLQGGPLGPSKFSSFSPVGPQRFLRGFRLLASSVLNWGESEQDWPLEGSFLAPRELGVPGHSEPKSHLIGHLRPLFPASSDRYTCPSKETLKCRLQDILPKHRTGSKGASELNPPSPYLF